MLKGTKEDEEEWLEKGKNPDKFRSEIRKEMEANPMTEYDVPVGNQEVFEKCIKRIQLMEERAAYRKKIATEIDNKQGQWLA